MDINGLGKNLPDGVMEGINKQINHANKQFNDINDVIIKEKRNKRAREIQIAESSKETAQIISEFKELVQRFIVASEEQTKATSKLNKRLFWFTIIATIATVVSTVMTVLQFINT